MKRLTDVEYIESLEDKIREMKANTDLFVSRVNKTFGGDNVPLNTQQAYADNVDLLNF